MVDDSTTAEDYNGMVEMLDGEVEAVFNSDFQLDVEAVSYLLSQGETPTEEEFARALTALTELDDARSELWTSLYLIARHRYPSIW